MTSSEEIHAKSVVVQVPLDALKVDRSYQRHPSQKLVDQMLPQWDILASDLILVSDRGERDPEGPVQGGMFIVNGQHRYLVAHRLAHKKIWARVVDLSGEENPAVIEASLRLKTNVGLNDRAAERFRAQVVAEDPESIAIVKILDTFGTEFNMVPNKTAGLNPITAVEQLYRWDEGPLLVMTFEVMRDAYAVVGGETATSSMLKGVGWFLESHSDEMLRDRLVTKIQEIGYAALDRRARASASTMGGTLWINFYRVLVELYNERLTEKTRLSWQMKGVSKFSGGQRQSRFPM